MSNDDKPVAFVHPDELAKLAAPRITGRGVMLNKEPSGKLVPLFTRPAAAPKLVIALPDYDKRKIVIASDETVDGERLVCVAIEDRPAAASGEAVAYSYECRQPLTDPVIWCEFFGRDKPSESTWIRNIVPLYAYPAPSATPALLGLTDAEIYEIYRSHGSTPISFARAIIAALKEAS